MPILLVNYFAAFDADITKSMGEAFDEACRELNGERVAVREFIAEQIIDAAQSGERDPRRLCASALAALRVARGL
jgi:hypothetical protein